MTKQNNGLRIFLITIAIFIAIGTVLYMIAPKLPVVGHRLSNTDYVAVLYVEGVISGGQASTLFSETGYNHDYILSQINAFIEDENNQGLVIFVNSPGGSIYETDEVYLKLMEYKDKTGCPVYISMGSLAASGGYYLSMSGDKVYANRNTLTGSIGVTLGTFYDISDFLDEHGIKTVTMTAGRNKAMGSMTEPMTEERIAIYQSILDDSYQQFVEIISKNRGLDIETVRTLADGRIYTARQALGHKLIDEIGTLDETIDAILYDHELEYCEVYYYYYEDTSLFSRLSGLANTGHYELDDIGTVLKLLDHRYEIPMGYICDWQW